MISIRKLPLSSTETPRVTCVQTLTWHSDRTFSWITCFCVACRNSATLRSKWFVANKSQPFFCFLVEANPNVQHLQQGPRYEKTSTWVLTPFAQIIMIHKLKCHPFFGCHFPCQPQFVQWFEVSLFSWNVVVDWWIFWLVGFAISKWKFENLIKINVCLLTPERYCVVMDYFPEVKEYI